ncbi:MAG: DUF2889 domain-containing protein [Ilumatobacteraceae bacterium]|nr:DUF2889 domain-containing protein [Ilumatobacteraceae bacterium]
MDPFDHSSILAPDPDGLEVLHDREYRVRAFRVDDDTLLIRGAVRDQKPPGLYLDEDVDPRPLTIHHMQVDLRIAFPALEIAGVDVAFEMHPNDECPTITEHYGNLVGLSIARGFTHKVRELFGGPRGCTHTTALLQAMAPVAVQCIWSMRASTMKRRLAGDESVTPPTPEQMRAVWASNLNTCHVWDEHGEWVQALEAGAPMPAPVFVRRRFAELGRDPQEWNLRMRG